MYVFSPDVFLSLHHAGAEDFGEVKELATYMLAFVAIYCLFDTVQIMFVAAIKGAGDTFFVVIATVISAACFLVAGSYSASFFESENSKITAWWISLTGWIVLLSVTYLTRFLMGRWKTCLLYTSPSPRDATLSRMPSSA